MVNTVYKGDLAEVSWGRETGLRLTGDNTANGWAVAAGATENTSEITVGSTAFFHSTTLLIPDNALVGCILRVSGGGNFTADDYATTRRVYYITANDTTTGKIIVQPQMATTTATANGGDTFTIDSIGCPTVDVNMTDASQKVLSDQFFGLLDTFGLPEPEIDVRKQHVVGMGRDVNVLTSGRETLAGGSMDMNAHTLRWMKYALGGWTSKSEGEFSTITNSNDILGENPLNIKDATATYRLMKHSVPATVDDCSALASLTLTGLSGILDGDTVLIGSKTATDTADEITLTAVPTSVHVAAQNTGIFKTLHQSTGLPLIGYYGAIATTVLQNCVDIDTGAIAAAQTNNHVCYLLASPNGNMSAGDLYVDVGATYSTAFVAGDYIQIFDKDTHTIPGADATLPTVFKHEIRRIIGKQGNLLMLEEPLLFDHLWASCGIERIQYAYGVLSNVGATTNAGRRGMPTINATTKQLSHGVEHTIFGYTSVPTFMVEQSFRQTDATPGREQMLRLFNGCKIASAQVSANTEGELKLNMEYEATRHYTDTSDVFSPHRMFENTAESYVNRAVSGIAVDGEKPYLFQNLSVEAFGAPVLRGTSFEFKVTNNNTARWYVRGYEGATVDADQVQHGGTHQPMDITEAQREYEFKFTAIVEDERFWTEMRTRKHHLNSNDITLRLNKPGSHATRENIVITLEDYTIEKANHPLPDDKGPVTAEIACVVRHLKIVENNPYYTI